MSKSEKKLGIVPKKYKLDPEPSKLIDKKKVKKKNYKFKVQKRVSRNFRFLGCDKEGWYTLSEQRTLEEAQKIIQKDIRRWSSFKFIPHEKYRIISIETNEVVYLQ